MVSYNLNYIKTECSTLRKVYKCHLYTVFGIHACGMIRGYRVNWILKLGRLLQQRKKMDIQLMVIGHIPMKMTKV